MKLRGKRVLVLGLGRSGVAAARLLVRQGARVTGYDRDTTRGAELAEAVEPKSDHAPLEARGGDAPLQVRSGPTPPPLDDFDLVVTSPGFPLAPDARAMPEIDLAASVLEARVVGVTGTNGKSTVTELIGDMLRRSDVRVAVGGNLGTPLCSLVDGAPEVVVAELSSFQLERAELLHAEVAVLLNLAPDHLDRHGDLAGYGRAKARLAELQDSDALLVCNLDDAWAASVPARGRRVGFSLEQPLEVGGFRDGKDLVVRDPDREVLRIALAELGNGVRSHPGNGLAAALAALACGARVAAVRESLERFEALPHRGRPVCVRRGVRYVDDSKATNPAAARASALAQSQPVIWLLGGRNKGLGFETLREAAPRVRLAIVYGESAPDLEAALAEALEVERARGLGDAIDVAATRAQPGDVVLLAPACASFDEFGSFEERGAFFAERARALADDSRSQRAGDSA